LRPKPAFTETLSPILPNLPTLSSRITSISFTLSVHLSNGQLSIACEVKLQLRLKPPAKIQPCIQTRHDYQQLCNDIQEEHQHIKTSHPVRTHALDCNQAMDNCHPHDQQRQHKQRSPGAIVR